MPLWVRVWSDDDLGAAGRHAAPLVLDGTIRMVPQIMNTLLLASVFSSRDQWYDGRRRRSRPGDRPDRARARGRPLDDALRALRRRGRRRPPLREDQGGVRADPRRRGLGHEVRRPRHARSSRIRDERVQGGVPSLDLNSMTRLVRRRAGRPHRLLAGRPDHRPGCARPARPAARDDREAGRARLHGRPDPHQRAQLHPRHAGDVRHGERGAGARRLRHVQAARRARRRSRATASTARTSTSWISPPSSTASTTTPTDASTRRSRTRSTRTASSRPASRESGRSGCGRSRAR